MSLTNMLRYDRESPKKISILKLLKKIGHRGFTLIEIMVSIAIIGTLASIATPNYISYRERAVIAGVIADFKRIETAAYAFKAYNERFPNTLIEAGLGNPVDPWGKAYVYYPIDNVPTGIKIRKNKELHPVNTDFDLYSVGKDGKSVAAFTGNPAKDDIVRANNGAFLGLVADY